jgi:hypothetical protein
MAGHGGILGGAFLIQVAFAVGSGLPTGFVVGEFVIIGVCLPFAASFPALISWARKAEEPHEDEPGSSAGEKDAAAEESVERVAGFVLIGAFLVQFAALAFLLWETGGPIESPFAEMTLAIAVFTPFLANNMKTVGSVLVASVTYYAVFILLYTNNHPKPSGLDQYEKTYALQHQSAWAYFWVNVMILIGAILFTVYESLARGWHQEAKMAGVGAGGDGAAASDGQNGGGADARKQTGRIGNELVDGAAEGPRKDDPDAEIRG